MIAQILTANTTSAAPVAEAAPAEGAAEGFAALMRGISASADMSTDQPMQPVEQQETAVDSGAMADGHTMEGRASDGDAAEVDAEKTPEGLMALLDDTIAELQDGAGQVTPKTALAGFAEALGEAPAETVGELEAVAQLADPELEAALQEKITAALRLTTGASQLSVASAAVPAVVKPATVSPAGAAKAGQGGLIDGAKTVSGAQSALSSVAMVSEGGPLPKGMATSPAPARETPVFTAKGQEAQGLSKTGLLTAKSAPDPSGNQTAASPLTPASATVRDDGSVEQLAQPRPIGVEQSLGQTDNTKTTAMTPADALLKGADPRLAASDQFTGATETAKSYSATPQSAGAETALRELGAAAPQPTHLAGEPVRLSPPAPTPPPAPNPTAAPEEQLRQHVTQQIRSLDVGDNKMRFSLSPFGMGEIEVEVMRSENGRMQIAMTTETASVLNVLRQDREQLLDALQARGISADSADLDFQTFGERGRQDGRDARGVLQENAEGPGELDGLTQSDAGSAPATRMTTGPGQLDILT